MSASLSHNARAEPNLTPILDMVFQLITFFMLVINFKSSLIDRKMELPVVGTSAPVDDKNQMLMMVNINNKGDFTVLGRPFSDDEMDRYIQDQAEQNRLAARRLNLIQDDKDDLPTTVVIRADMNTPYRRLNQVISKCQDNGFVKFGFRYMTKAPPARPAPQPSA
jgi:biopolymer transport protein ExbD